MLEEANKKRSLGNKSKMSQLAPTTLTFKRRLKQLDSILHSFERSLPRGAKRSVIQKPQVTMARFVTTTSSAKPATSLSRPPSQPIRSTKQAMRIFAQNVHLPAAFQLILTWLAMQMAASQSTHITQNDPRPTIYSGQVSFGLLLSAHSSLGSEMSTSASHRVLAIARLEDSSILSTNKSQTTASNLMKSSAPLETEPLATSSSSFRPRRQIFETTQARRQQQASESGHTRPPETSSTGAMSGGQCSQVNPNALYAGMGAIWASHQANLVGDSQFTIGAYVYDSCNDLDVGQRQSVRIVSNLNAFQQTTCESPRGSPISLIIAHGENQLRAIQLLTSFRVPVISTKEHFALEDYSLLTKDQRRFLFSTAPSSRHLAMGALRFTKRVVAKLASSPKLPNRFHSNSRRQALVVISRNLPARFISYITEITATLVNYELIQSSSPIDQIRSIAALESVLLNKDKDSTTSAMGGSESSDQLYQQASGTLPSLSRPELDQHIKTRGKRSELGEDGGSDDSSSSEQEQARMLSPTLLMFITPAEAIDLITRLRNDLAEVSKYYALIVVTQEDITPALKTIFHRGGSRLCSGKAFYTIAPKPDSVSEFERYFRETVQLEAELSDHPLISEFYKYQAGSRINADLDDVSAEPVIKAVWAAAAAFKAVHRRECGDAMALVSNFRGSGGASDDRAPSQTRQLKSRQPSGQPGATSQGSGSGPTAAAKTAHTECMMKMSKTMSHMVQRSLKNLNVTINSTGLQSLDGFRIRFDDMNELMSNKFRIQHISRECEIEELGHFSGFSESQLSVNSEAHTSALESIMPDPWPVPPPPPPPPPPTAPPTTVTRSNQQASSTTSSNPETTSSTSTSSDEPSSGSDTNEANRKLKGAESVNIDSTGLSKPDEEEDPSGGNESNFEAGNGRRTNKRSRTSNGDISQGNKKLADEIRLKKRRPQQHQRVTSGNLGVRRGLSDSTEHPETTIAPGRPMRPLKPFPTAAGTSLKDWLPASSEDSEQVSQRAHSTQSPPHAYTTLPESDGNADLEPHTRPTVGLDRQTSTARSLEAAATTESSSYISLPSNSLGATGITRLPALNLHSYGRQNSGYDPSQDGEPMYHQSANRTSQQSHHLNLLKDLNFNPIPLTSSQIKSHENLGSHPEVSEQQSESRTNRSQLRSHLKWIYNSWSALGILIANIFGALLTLYVLTFLLLKNCDGSLDRDNQGLRSIHLLGIIIVFFGSTLFIVSPTPGLCLLRTSWHNFSLVLLFGSLLLKTMQTRSLSTLGLGGRPNKLNQFLTLIFMVGVQVAIELQRWKYESANYLSFINQNFGAPESDYKKLMILGNAIVNQFNPLSPFNDLVTPVSIQVSEKYQNLLHDYCLQKPEDFLQSQIYLSIIIALLILFSITTRNLNASGGNYRHQASHPQSASFLTSGKMVASEHEANLTTSQTHSFKPSFQANSSMTSFDGGAKMFPVTIMGTSIYMTSVLLQYYGQGGSNSDLISSVSMVLIAFITLLGIFLPILSEIHRYDTMSSSLPRNIVQNQSMMPDMNGNQHIGSMTRSKTFTMFPEFAQSGIRRPSSISGDSSSGAGSRSPFAETKESRRNMGFTLANLAPSVESLRGLGFYGQDGDLNEKSNRDIADRLRDESMQNQKSVINQSHPTNLKQSYTSNRRHDSQPQESDQIGEMSPKHYKNQSKLISKGGEKRLIMLDVDPSCPRHGHAVQSKSKDPCSSKGRCP